MCTKDEAVSDIYSSNAVSLQKVNHKYNNDFKLKMYIIQIRRKYVYSSYNYNKIEKKQESSVK